jgi:hypothetical protein
MQALQFSTRMEQCTCATCGIAFAMPASFMGALRNNKKEFFCPNGHSLSFNEREVDRLQREKERLARELEVARVERDAARKLRDENAAKAEKASASLRRLKARVGGGSCPCCKRHFPDLRRHMESKHPEEAARRG